jgi:MFS family permease
MPEIGDQANGQPTETSPLISRDDVQAAEGDGGLAPEAPHGITSDAADAGDGDGLERQASATDRQKQYDGLPEVKKNLKYIVPAVAIGVFLGAADQTIVVSAYGKIGSDLDALNLTSWIATAYFLTLTSFQPLYGKLSDIFGRKICLLWAYTIFGTGCVFCGLARNMEQLILARAYAGIGGGGMNTVVSIMFSDIVPLRERGKWQGYINIVFAAGASSGAPLGGLLADSIGWRWAFIGQGPICLVAFIAVSLALNLPKRDDSHWKKKFARIDFLGAAVLISAVFTLLVALDRGSNVSWKATITLVTLGLSLPLFVIFILVEMKFAKEPFAPGRVIFSRTMIACFLCNFFSMAGYLAALFYVPLYFQAVDGLSSTGAGLRLIPAIVGSVIGSLFGGFYMQKTGRFYWLTVICYLQLTIGMIIVTLASGPLITSTPLVIVGLAVAALGNGVGVTSTLIGLIANASHDDQAIATACSYLFRSLGSVFGISMSATVANQALRNNLANELPRLGLPEKEAAAIADRVRQSLAYLRQLEPDVRALVVDCYAKSTTAAFVLQVVLLAGAAISAWWIKEKALSN